MYVSTVVLTSSLDEFAGFFAIWVFAIAYCLFQIALSESFYDEGMGTLVVVAFNLYLVLFFLFSV